MNPHDRRGSRRLQKIRGNAASQAKFGELPSPRTIQLTLGIALAQNRRRSLK
jgi:hypothetical protein